MKLHVLASVATLSFLAMAPLPVGPGVFPPAAHFFGKTYAEWSAENWRFIMEYPVDDPLHPHPIDSSAVGAFDASFRQSGPVWFLAAPLDFGPAVPRVRDITVPVGKALFVGTVDAEMSSQEGVPDEPTQRAIANFLADHITYTTFSVDGPAVQSVDAFRFDSPQFAFTAPDPWIFGPGGAGESGTSVADGYYFCVKPLSVGQHVIHYTGGFHFDAGELGPDPVDLNLDMTYNVTVP